MGIPAYFYNIIKSYPNIIKDYSKSLNVNNFYLDSNSIIYDVIHNNKSILLSLNNNSNMSHMYKKIIDLVIDKIDYYIDFISPKDLVYIAFDGVAPLAKLNHQRERRYKSILKYKSTAQLSLKDHLNNDNEGSGSGSGSEEINTNFITPGTEFMKLLNKELTKYYYSNLGFKEIKGRKYKIIFSGSDQKGEGEHKIYEYIRLNKDTHKDKTVIVYGLDADLIILSLNHLHILNNLYLCREMIRQTNETEQNKKSDMDLNAQNQQSDPYIVDIYLLANKIQSNILSQVQLQPQQQSQIMDKLHYGIIHDYVFLSFFLGNDFMPKFPVLNLRTKGIGRILKCYKELLKEICKCKNEFIGESLFILNIFNDERKKINWPVVFKFISLLASNEKNWAFDEYVERDNFSKTVKDINSDNIPMLCRETEKYIAPIYPNWEYRYYNALFSHHYDSSCKEKDNIDNIKKFSSINFIEGLEWCVNYYSFKCINYEWFYKYDYAPLLVDLLDNVPLEMGEICGTKWENDITEDMQLAYVLPKESYDLLEIKTRKIMETMMGDVGDKNFKLLKEISSDVILNNYDIYFNYSYCRYLWESHLKIDLPEFSIIKKNLIDIN